MAATPHGLDRPTDEQRIAEFVQTARAQIEELDRWQQTTEEEARLAYEMTLRNAPVAKTVEAIGCAINGHGR